MVGIVLGAGSSSRLGRPKQTLPLGDTTVLGVKVAARNRLPASFFVSVSYACWAHRRRGVVLDPTTNAITAWLYETPTESLPHG